MEIFCCVAPVWVFSPGLCKLVLPPRHPQPPPEPQAWSFPGCLNIFVLFRSFPSSRLRSTLISQTHLPSFMLEVKAGRKEIRATCKAAWKCRVSSSQMGFVSKFLPLSATGCNQDVASFQKQLFLTFFCLCFSGLRLVLKET